MEKITISRHIDYFELYLRQLRAEEKCFTVRYSPYIIKLEHGPFVIVFNEGKQIGELPQVKKERRSDERHISIEVRRKVFERDKGKCLLCGAKNNLQYDHIIPFTKGGSNTEKNIQLLCSRCNNDKSNKI